MSRRLREPIRFIRAHGTDSYLDALSKHIDDRLPWARRFIDTVGLRRFIAPAREKLAARWIRGEGIEIGAQATPLRVPPGVRVRYVDCRTHEESLQTFREVSADELVKPDIVTDGFTLEAITDASQDFVVANHVLEHSPDPIFALRNWLRVLRRGGILFATVPIAELCFDRGRELTTLEHLIEDFEAARHHGSEALHQRNRAHYEEWITISDTNVRTDKGQPRLEPHEWTTQIEWFISQRAEIHFHTFTPDSYATLLRYVAGMPDVRAEIESMIVSSAEVIAIVRRGSTAR